MNGSKKRMDVGKLFFILTCTLTLSAFTWGAAPRKVREGNRLLKEGQVAEALNRYHEAQMERPEAPEIPFNMGNGFYRQKKYKEAEEAHTRSIQLGSESLAAKAHYNIGNARYREGDLQGALEAYKEAVDLDSKDRDTKYNIEFIQRQMQKMHQPEKETSSRQEREEKPEQEQQQESSGNQDNQDKGGGEQKKKEDEAEAPTQQLPSPSLGNISRQDAERLLGALQTEEKSLPVAQEADRPRLETPVEKDW